MLPLAYPRRWQLASAVLLLLVLGAALAPALLPWLTNEAPALPQIDKWMHGITFAFLALWFTGQYARRTWAWIVLGLCVYGAIIEVGQSFIPYRTAEWADLAADALGALVGIAIAATVTGGWSVRAEAWMEARFG